MNRRGTDLGIEVLLLQKPVFCSLVALITSFGVHTYDM